MSDLVQPGHFSPGHAEPEVPVLHIGERGVEQDEMIEDGPSHDDRAHADAAPEQGFVRVVVSFEPRPGDHAVAVDDLEPCGDSASDASMSSARTWSVSLWVAQMSSASRNATKGAVVAEMPALRAAESALVLAAGGSDARIEGRDPAEVLGRPVVDDDRSSRGSTGRLGSPRSGVRCTPGLKAGTTMATSARAGRRGSCWGSSGTRVGTYSGLGSRAAISVCVKRMIGRPVSSTARTTPATGVVVVPQDGAAGPNQPERGLGVGLDELVRGRRRPARGGRSPPRA